MDIEKITSCIVAVIIVIALIVWLFIFSTKEYKQAKEYRDLKMKLTKLEIEFKQKELKVFTYELADEKQEETK